MTPLHFAVQGGHLKVIKLLIDHGADMDAKGAKREDTPLHWASMAGRIEVAKLLLENGANITIKDKYGRTPLDVVGTVEMRKFFEKRSKK